MNNVTDTIMTGLLGVITAVTSEFHPRPHMAIRGREFCRVMVTIKTKEGVYTCQQTVQTDVHTRLQKMMDEQTDIKVSTMYELHLFIGPPKGQDAFPVFSFSGPV